MRTNTTTFFVFPCLLCIYSSRYIVYKDVYSLCLFITWNPKSAKGPQKSSLDPKGVGCQADFLGLKDPGDHLSREGSHFIVEGPEVGDATMATSIRFGTVC